MSQSQKQTKEQRRVDTRHGTLTLKVGKKSVNVVVKNPIETIQDPHENELTHATTLDAMTLADLKMPGAMPGALPGALPSPVPSPGKYAVPPVYGGKGPIYNFLAPPEQLNGNLASSDAEKREMLIYYFTHLYPKSSPSKWGSMSTTQLSNYYYNLDFWYTFNPSWGVTPFPVTLDSRVIAKWEKNTFYQAGTIIQSAITALCWDLDSSGQKFYYAGRMNNAPQVDPSLTYKTKAGKSKTIRNVCRDKEFWEGKLGKSIETTSWGWSPYPFGMYAQGPFNGTGNFLNIPTKAIVGTSHWDVIYQCKSAKTTDAMIWAAILTHEISRAVPGTLFMGNKVNVTPWVIHKKGGTYWWGNLFPNGTGYTPMLVSYACFIMGGFGGIGDPWKGNYGPFMRSWSYGDGQWGAGYYYAPVIEEVQVKGKTVLQCAVDQSIPRSVNLQGFENGRENNSMWDCFSHMFKDHISQWDTNYAIEMWRYPLFSSGEGVFYNTGPCVNNPCDDFMMAMATGNFDIVHYSPWGASPLDPALSKFSSSPMQWSHILNPDGSVRDSGGKGFPTGKLTKVGPGHTFVVRCQMPNVNGDICQEFADFRVLVPGELATGSGDQVLWGQMFADYCAKYMSTRDPFDDTKFSPFSGDYAPWIPDTSLVTVKPKNNWWKHSNNVATQKTFFDFDVASGKWVTWLSYCGRREGKNLAFEKLPADVSSTGVIFLKENVLNNEGDVVNVPETCKLPDPMKNVEPTPLPGALKELGGNASCYEGKGYMCQDWWNCRNATVARTNDEYYVTPTDSFSTGIVGFQGNGWYANIGACQTRWWINSSGIPWNFDAPLANRLIMKSGLRLKGESHALKACGMPIELKIILIILVAAALFISGYALYKKPMRYKLIAAVSMIVALVALLGILFAPSAERKKEETQLRVYFTLVYPTVPIKRWQNMPFWQLRKFYCSLHQWYRGDGLPSPLDYKNSSDWEGQPPFSLKTSWKNFTTRKSCVNGTPRALNPYDNNVVIGYDGHVDTTDTETPTGILFRKRQVNACGEAANIQHVTFFSPSFNMWVDTFNHMSSVNDTGLKYWQNAQYVEVSSQWGPFPDGAYFDWAQGTGVWLKLGKHAVGYNGQDLVRRLGEEVIAGLPKLMDGFKNVYFQLWQRTGFDGMNVGPDGVISNPDTCTMCGLYGTIIMTQQQMGQIVAVKKPDQWWAHSGDVFDLADGELYTRLAMYVAPSYYDVKLKKWSAEMPVGQGHIKNYPLPLPFGERYVGDGKGAPVMNEYALNMPWKYQQFNISSMYRGMTVDALFLNAEAISYADMVRKGADYNYVDILKASQTNPLAQPNTWEQAIETIHSLLGKPVPHPFFSIYPRILGQGQDGPMLILYNNDEWKKGKPSLKRVQTGALDKSVYLQDTVQSKGVKLNAPMDAPQLNGADLEIDHWTSALSKILGYDTAARIQHWCGNKSMAYDLEVICFRIPIPGNLITNNLYGNIYEIWKNAYAEGWLTLRDPFYPTNHVYTDTYKDIYSGSDITSASKKATWLIPPWIGYDQQKNLYGWEPESLTNWANIQRLAYLPIAAEEIGFSNSYPEYNKYIMRHFMKLLS
jgi:hypothetical protein